MSRVPHQTLLTSLLPPHSYQPHGPRLQAELAGEGSALDQAEADALRLAGAVTPLQADALLPEWERVCGITPQPLSTYQQRQQAVLAKLTETGGLSVAYFQRLARSLGYHISIDELQPFRAGVNRAGQPIWRHDIHWVWRVNVQGSKVRPYRFRAGRSLAGERLTSFGDPQLEALFDDLKPAHSYVYFAYHP